MVIRRLVSLPWSLLFGSLFVFLTAIGLVGNLIVIIAISGDRKMRKSVMNMLLLNLAVADALNLVTTTVEWTHTIALGFPAWVFPDVLCPVARYFECVFLFTSILTQLTVCVERYIAIVYPIHARRLCSRANILVTVVFIWVFVAISALPYALLNEKRATSRVCANRFTHTSMWTFYKWAEFFSFYFLPCIVFICLYSKVCCVLWAKNHQLYEITETVSAAELSTRADALATRRSVVKMLVACVSIYFVCYSPIQAIFLSKALFDVNLSPPYEFILLMNALAMTCSACNPLLYTLFSKRFRARITRLLACGIVANGNANGCETSKILNRTCELTYNFTNNTKAGSESSIGKSSR